MKTVSSTEAKAQLNALLAEVERTGSPVTITTHGRPVAVLTPVQPRPRMFGQLPALAVGEDFDEPLPESEIAAWEGNPGANRPEV
ncbi:MAG: type II toxin-antitoxin system Phd/YefM family antitoxin [Mycobacteriaceae bacterium]